MHAALPVIAPLQPDVSSNVVAEAPAMPPATSVAAGVDTRTPFPMSVIKLCNLTLRFLGIAETHDLSGNQLHLNVMP